jgi:hypothetical protein
VAAALLVAVGMLLTGCGAESADRSAAPDEEASGAGWRVAHEPAGRGVPAASQVTPERPVALMLPNGTRMPVIPVSTERSGALQLPEDIFTAGWWDGGSRLGDPYGAMVVAAHVDSFTQGLGPFVGLQTIRAGERIRLISDTFVRDFKVRTTRFVPRESLPGDPDAFVRKGPPRLVLITCGGPYDAGAGGYRDNVIVVAYPD